MEIKNKFNLNDLVFVFAQGKIIHCKVKCIGAYIDNDVCRLRYTVNALDSAYDKYLDEYYFEDELCTRLEDIINILEVH